MKMKCTKTVEFMGVEVYTEGQIYSYTQEIQDGEIKGYKISGNGGIGFVSIEDDVLNNFEEYEDTYEIKAIFNRDIDHQSVNVFTLVEDEFIHISDEHTEKGKKLTYNIEEIVSDRDWTVFEVINGNAKRIKRKNLIEVLENYDIS